MLSSSRALCGGGGGGANGGRKEMLPRAAAGASNTPPQTRVSRGATHRRLVHHVCWSFSTGRRTTRCFGPVCALAGQDNLTEPAATNTLRRSMLLLATLVARKARRARLTRPAREAAAASTAEWHANNEWWTSCGLVSENTSNKCYFINRTETV